MPCEVIGSSEAGAVRLGIAVSLSGRYALLGRQVRAGLECYIEDVNLAGGMRIRAGEAPRPVALVVEDDASDPQCCAQLVRKLIDRHHVDLLMGPYGSGPTLAAARVAESARVVLWNHSGSGDQIFAAGLHWMVGIISPASSYLCGVLELLRARDPAARRVALFSAETGFAAEVAAGVESWIARAGYTLCAHHRYPSGTEDFRPLLRALAIEPPDILLGVGRVEDDIQLARDLCAVRLPVKAAGLVVAAIDAFQQQLGAAVQGFLAPSQWEAGSRTVPEYGPSAADFVARLAGRQSKPADYPAAQGYAGALIAQCCVAAAGTLEQGALREAASRLRTTTFYGPFAIDPASGRQSAHEMLVTQWQAGRKCIVWPPAAARTDLIYPARW